MQDQTFHESKAARDKKLDELSEETARVLEWGQRIVEEKNPEELEELIREGEEQLGGNKNVS